MKSLVDADERWLDVVGYEGLYSVSNKGRVYSQPRTEFVSTKTRGYYRYRQGKILLPHSATNRYSHVILCKDGTHKTHQIHRLVLETFSPDPTGALQVNHKNGLKIDNCLENLEWVTGQQNQIHSVEVLGHHRGVKQANSKLTEDQVVAITFALVSGETENSIAKRFSVKRGTISSIKCGKNWAWLTGFRKG